MAKHRVKRHGICQGINFGTFFIPTDFFVDITTGNEYLDLGIRTAVSFGIAFGIARAKGWHHEK